MILSKTRITNALISLRGCEGWSAPLLFANPRRQVFTWRGPNNLLVVFFSLSFSIYCLALAFEHYRQVYIVHSGLQDESLQVTISKLPQGSLTCTRGDFPCTGDIQLTSRSEGRCTYPVSSLQMTLEKATKRVRTPKFSSPRAGIEPGTSRTRGKCSNHCATTLCLNAL